MTSSTPVTPSRRVQLSTTFLSDKAKEVSLSIFDDAGNEIRTFGSDEISMDQFTQADGSEYSGGQVAGQAIPSVGMGAEPLHMGHALSVGLSDPGTATGGDQPDRRAGYL